MFHNQKLYCWAHRGSPLVLVLRQMNPLSIVTSVFSYIHFNFILLTMRRSPKWSVPHRYSYLSFVRVSFLQYWPSAHLIIRIICEICITGFSSVVVFLSCGFLCFHHQTPRLTRIIWPTVYFTVFVNPTCVVVVDLLGGMSRSYLIWKD